MLVLSYCIVLYMKSFLTNTNLYLKVVPLVIIKFTRKVKSFKQRTAVMTGKAFMPDAPFLYDSGSGSVLRLR